MRGVVIDWGAMTAVEETFCEDCNEAMVNGREKRRRGKSRWRGEFGFGGQGTNYRFGNDFRDDAKKIVRLMER
jgi:hypothetical protein